MADTKISALPAATTPVAGTEEFPIVQGGTTDRLTINGIFTGTGRQIPFDAGLVTAPAVSFNGDLDTGVWSSAANTVDISAGGVRALQLGTVASAVNYVKVGPSTTGNYPAVAANGSDTNIGFDLRSKGTGPVRLATNDGGQVQFQASHTASAVNYLQATGAITGGGPVLSAQGSDTNVRLTLSSKGAEGVRIRTNSLGSIVHDFVYAASAVNYLVSTQSATGVKATLSAEGTDTNIDLGLSPKGTGTLDMAIPVAVGAAVASTHKITVKISGVTYYLLASNV